MDFLERQAALGILDDLRVRIAPTLTDPTAIASLGMAQHVLAHLLVRKPELPQETMSEEVRRLEDDEREEGQYIAGRSTASHFQILTPELLEPYLQQRLGDIGVRIKAIDATLGGFSKLTYIVHLAGADAIGNALVIRRDPEFGPVEVRAAEELPVLRAMHRHGVAVAEPLWADDPSPFGGSFVVTRCSPGRSAFGKSGLGLESKSVPAALAFARVLAKVHRVPITALALPDEVASAPTPVHVARMLDALKDQWQRRRVQYSPTIDAVFNWVRAHIPQQTRPPTIVHGDASLRNFLVHEDRESALIDWELWHLGDPTEDLALCKPEIEQIMPWEIFMAEYRAHGGHDYEPAVGAYYSLLIPLWHTVLTGCCLHGLESAATPELRTSFAGTYHHRRLVREIAQRLSEVQS